MEFLDGILKRRKDGGMEDPQALKDAGIRPKIGSEAVEEAERIRQRYKQGKNNLDARIVSNEQWYKLRHWEQLRKETEEVEPTSAWLFNCIANKHADAMDNYPSVNVLPREAGDQAEAQKLSAIIPVVMDQNGFEKTYNSAWWYKLKNGCGVYGVFWDAAKHNGLGDISIKRVDLLNLFWEPGITDIQESPNLFHCELVANEVLEAKYPQLRDKLSTPTATITQYMYDDSVPTAEKSVVVDWYYKIGGVLHFCKYVNNEVLFATENEPEKYPEGWYRHGRYPFEFDVLFPEEGTPAGFGYIDICKDPQAYIDILGRALLKNALANSQPRYFVRADEEGINESEFLDVSKPLVHTKVNLDDGLLKPIAGTGLDAIYVTLHNNKIDELKETSGNRDINTGGSSSGVTAASAIAAMQEAGSKLSRDMIRSSYNAYENVVQMVIELIRQFYDDARAFRIIGENGAMEFVRYSNTGLKPQPQGTDFGMDMGFRLPLFDLEIIAQKASPYSKMAQNEMALQFYQLGFFNPQMADQSLACLEMMDFDRKDTVVRRIQQNGGMAMQLQQISGILLQLASQYRPDLVPQLQAMIGGQAVPAPVPGGDVDTGDINGGESSVTADARKRVADSTAPS